MPPDADPALEVEGRLGALIGKQNDDADAEREARIDRELFEAGVAPGDPSLLTPPAPEPGHEHGHEGHDHHH